MSLADLVRGAVALAHSVTRDGGLQETVSLKRWRSEDSYGVPTYATALTLQALVERKRRAFRRPSGEDIVSQAAVTFLQAIPALSPSVPTRKGLIDERDQIVLADGSTGPILHTDSGLTDPLTGGGYLMQVYLG